MSVTGGTTGAQGAASWSRWVRTNLGVAATAVARPPRLAAARSRGLRAAGLVAALLVVAVTMVFADAALAQSARRLPSWVHATFAFVTDFGKSGWFLWPTGALLLAIALVASPALAPIHRLVLAAVAVRVGFLFVAIAAPSLFVTVIKRVIGRARPFVGEQTDPFLYLPMVWRASYASLPSGHATTAFAAAVAVTLLWPRLRALMLFYAVVIAVSRVALDAHFASDVIAGAIVGTAGALMVRNWFAARRLGFAADANGVVHTLPGPSWARIKRVARSLAAP
jgi:membrane-associated phospholipid phosphatase